jgi:hypothetical protein
MRELYVVINIGCIECGVSSNIVGLFDDKDKANKIADTLENKYDWREGGQNRYEVFKLNDINEITEEYKKFIHE